MADNKRIRAEFRSALERVLEAALADAGERVSGRRFVRHSCEEIRLLLQPLNATEQMELFRTADLVRASRFGDEVHLRGIIEFSNYCRCDCLYCGLRKSNHRLRRYRLGISEIWEIAREAAALGYRTLVLQSGEDTWYTVQELAPLVSRLKTELQVAVTLSIGERSFEDYARLREAGADRYLLKHETSDPVLFSRYRPGRTLEERLQCLDWLRELGYQIGSGNMVGLPGQSVDTLAGDILLLADLDVEMAGIGPFIPHGDTPLGEYPGGKVGETLNVLAVTRLVLPQVHLPATTALGSIDPEGRQKALRCGANVIMPNVTPLAYRPDYQIYPNKICLQEEPEHCRGCVESLICGLGRRVALNRGDSPKAKEDIQNGRRSKDGQGNFRGTEKAKGGFY